MRPLPEPEDVPDVREAIARPKLYFAQGQHDFMTRLCERAWAIVNRCFEQPGPVPHGWYDTIGFIDRCRRGDARNRLYRAIWWQLAAKAVQRGQLQLERKEG